MEENTIEPTAFIGPNVELGRNNYVGHFTVIDGNVRIADNNFISHHVVIGQLSQNSVHKYELHGYPNDNLRRITIGSNNVIREFSTVHLPMETETSIGDNCYLMAYNHVSHDTRLENNVILSNNIQIGGFTVIQKFVNIGLSSVVHQFSTIGAYSMLGMGTIVSKDIPPYLIVMGAPVRSSGKINEVGLRRNGFTEKDIHFINELYFKKGVAILGSAPHHLGSIIESFKNTSRRKIVADDSPLAAIFAK